MCIRDRAQGECTVSTLANTLHITKSAVTIKVNELERLGMVTKTRSETDRRVIQLDCLLYTSRCV